MTTTISMAFQQIFITPGIEKACYKCEINGVISPTTTWKATNPITGNLESVPTGVFISYGTMFDGVLGIYDPEDYVEPGVAGRKQLICSTSSGSLSVDLLSPGSQYMLS